MAKLWKGAMEFAYDNIAGEDWTPTIGIVGPDDGTNQAASVLTETLARAITSISSNQVLCGDIRTGTWTPDSTPYNPDASHSKTLGIIGEKLTNGNLVDLEIVWKVVKNVGGGLPGMLNLRGVLGENDLDAVDTGRWSIVSDSAYSPIGTAQAYLNNAMADFLSTGASAYKMAVISRPLIGKLADGTKLYGAVFARLIHSLGVDGVGTLNLTKRRKPLGGSRVPTMAGVPMADNTVTVLGVGGPGAPQPAVIVTPYEEWLAAQA